MLLFTLTFSLFVLFNPIGNVPLFVSHLQDYPTKKKHTIIIRELLIALGVIIFFMFLGQPLLKLLSIDQHSISISGSIILFIVAMRMVFPVKGCDHNNHNEPQREPLIVPLAIPFVAGPGILTTIMIYSAQTHNLFLLFIALLIAWSGASLIIFFSPLLATLLGKRGIIACERLMGLLLTVIAVQMFLSGIKQVFCIR